MRIFYVFIKLEKSPCINFDRFDNKISKFVQKTKKKKFNVYRCELKPKPI